MMDRRKFVKISTAALLTERLSLLSGFGSGVSASKHITSVWELENIKPDRFSLLFEALGGIEKLLETEPSKATVLIKPNLCLPRASQYGATTSPLAVESLCRMLISKGVKKIIVADHTLKKSEDFENDELIGILKNYSEVNLILADEEKWFQPFGVPGKVLKQTAVLKFIRRADLVINMATAKHHSATHVSLSLKNLMGFIWNRTDFHIKMDLSQAIADLALAVKPHLSMIDATRVLLNGGPTGPGPILNDNRLFAAFDMLALDSVVVSRYNFGGKSVSPSDIPHLSAAYSNRVGEINLEKIKVVKM